MEERFWPSDDNSIFDMFYYSVIGEQDSTRVEKGYAHALEMIRRLYDASRLYGRDTKTFFGKEIEGGRLRLSATIGEKVESWTSRIVGDSYPVLSEIWGLDPDYSRYNVTFFPYVLRLNATDLSGVTEIAQSNARFYGVIPDLYDKIDVEEKHRMLQIAPHLTLHRFLKYMTGLTVVVPGGNVDCYFARTGNVIRLTRLSVNGIRQDILRGNPYDHIFGVLNTFSLMYRNYCLRNSKLKFPLN